MQALIFGIPAGFGVSRTQFAELVWQVPVAIVFGMTIWAVLQFIFTRYRITDRAVELQRGALFRKRVNLGFDRIQNVSIAEPFYFRPLGLANLSIDSAGSAKDEVVVAALSLHSAEELRTYISAMRQRSGAVNEATVIDDKVSATQVVGELFFSRALRDLVIHGLTNNRAFIAVAGIVGVYAQSGITPVEIAAYLGIEFDVVIGGLSLVRLAFLFVLSSVLVIGLLALLSVIVSIVSYYGFSMYRRGARLIIRRGLINKHEIAIRKSRIQLIRFSQDWLDYLFDRRNLYLEQLTHGPQGAQPFNNHVIVPSVRLSETHTVTNEIWPLDLVEKLEFTPLNWRWFRKLAVLFTAAAVLAIIFLTTVVAAHPGVIAGVIAAWPVLIALVYLTWKRGGIAVVGDMIIARSGTIGINYRLFPIAKLQDVTHIQTPFMRRNDLSSLLFMTASSKIKVPYLPGAFARQVINYSLFDVESRPRSWM